jgi:hypothetical protein
MKLSLWQQFSSNHSASFSLVGHFKTAQEAENAATVIRGILEKIADWYKTHPEVEEEVRKGDLVNPTPMEAELAKQYGLEKAWEFTVDWVNPKHPNQGLQIFDKLVFLHNATETWVGAQPFDELLKKLGATIETSVEGITETEPVINLTCLAPDEQKAAEIVGKLHSTRAHVTSDGEYTERLIKLPGKHPPYNGLIQNDGARIECTEIATSTLNFKPVKLVHAAEFLPALVAYLESQGCKDFDFSISSRELE